MDKMDKMKKILEALGDSIVAGSCAYNLMEKEGLDTYDLGVELDTLKDLYGDLKQDYNL